MRAVLCRNRADGRAAVPVASERGDDPRLPEPRRGGRLRPSVPARAAATRGRRPRPHIEDVRASDRACLRRASRLPGVRVGARDAGDPRPRHARAPRHLGRRLPLRPQDGDGDDTYVLCEINVSSTFAFPEFAMPTVAKAAIERIQERNLNHHAYVRSSRALARSPLRLAKPRVDRTHARCAWRVHGVCMACAWRVHGVCMACAWRVYGCVWVCMGVHVVSRA